MAFEWRKMYKSEDNIEYQINDIVYDTILSHYEVDEISDLTEENIKEVQSFYDDMNEYSVMCIGFVNLIGTWEEESGNG